MDNGTRDNALYQANEPPAWFRKVPFAGEILIAAYSLAFVPVGFAVHFAMEREWAYSVALALSWLALFPFIASAFHRHRLVHIAVSVFAAVTLLGAGALFLWLANEHAV